MTSLTERLNEQLLAEAEILMGADHGIPLGISIGIVINSGTTGEFQILFQYADSALYEVKRNGKHGCRIYDPQMTIAEGPKDLDQELSNVIRIMSERGEGKGAMLLGQEAFSWNYRFIVRYLERFGGEAIRLLFYLSSKEKGVIFSEMVSEFGNVLKNTLRKSDIIHQWQQNRFFVVLVLAEEETMPEVVGRIMKAWSQTGYKDRIDISYTASSLRKELYESKE